MSEEIEYKDGTKRAWLTVVGLGFLMGGGLIQILANSGNFIPFICMELGCDPTELVFWITLYAIFMAIAQPVVGRAWGKVNTKLMITVAFLVSMGALAAMSFYTEVWQFYISGALIGLSGGFYFMVATPFLVTQWFAQRQGLAMGVAGIIGGVFSVILSPVDAALVGAFGWRTAYLIVVAISCVMVLPFSLFVFEYDPAKLKMRPAYYDAEAAAAAHQEQGSMPGIPEKKAVTSIVFVCVFIVGGVVALFGGFKNLYTFAALEWGYDATLASLMISAANAFTFVGPFIGLLIDKIGPWKTSYVSLAIAVVGGIGFLFAHGSQVAILIWAFLFAFTDAIVGNTVPLMTRDAFGPKAYTKVFSYMQIGIGLIGGFSTPVISGIFTATGTFGSSIMFGIGICAVAAVLLALAMANKKKLQEKYWED